MPGRKSEKWRGRTAYSYFVKHYREALGKSNIFIGYQCFPEFSRHCGQQWRTLSADEKAPFNALVELDKARRKAESRNSETNKNSNESSRVIKKKKDPNAPKGPLSPFFWFCNSLRSKVREMHPEYRAAEVSKALGQYWTNLDPCIREQYYLLEKLDKQRYKQEMLVYMKNVKSIGDVQEQRDKKVTTMYYEHELKKGFC